MWTGIRCQAAIWELTEALTVIRQVKVRHGEDDSRNWSSPVVLWVSQQCQNGPVPSQREQLERPRLRTVREGQLGVEVECQGPATCALGWFNVIVWSGNLELDTAIAGTSLRKNCLFMDTLN